MPSFIEGNNFDYLTQFSRFYQAMQLSNIMLLPTYCGTQCGCRQAEVKLSYIINKIVNQREENEDSEDLEEINPLIGFNDLFY